MLEGITTTIYGRDAAEANRLITLGGSVTLAAAAETLVTAASANEYGYLSYMRADCTVASTTPGTWSLRLDAGGPVVLIFQQPVTAAPVGSNYCWPFPVPWKTTNKGGQFTLTPSVATMGTWQFIVNGFHSAL